MSTLHCWASIWQCIGSARRGLAWIYPVELFHLDEDSGVSGIGVNIGQFSMLTYYFNPQKTTIILTIEKRKVKLSSSWTGTLFLISGQRTTAKRPFDEKLISLFSHTTPPPPPPLSSKLSLSGSCAKKFVVDTRVGKTWLPWHDHLMIIPWSWQNMVMIMPW